MVTTRRQAREWAIQMLTAADLNPAVTAERLVADFWSQFPTLAADEGGLDGRLPRGKIKTFAEERVTGVLAHIDEIDAILARLLKDWDLERLGTVERAVLRMGVWEMKFSDVPKPVIINEAIDLGNWFSSPRSRPLINGVLDRLAKEG